MNLIVLARVRVFGILESAPCAGGKLRGDSRCPMAAMTRGAGCELNLVTTLRHMIKANNRLNGLS